MRFVGPRRAYLHAVRGLLDQAGLCVIKHHYHEPIYQAEDIIRDPDAPRTLIFSPHPDDEVIIGALPLRLLRELKMNVINVAVTQGSHKARQPERWKELSCEAMPASEEKASG